MDAVPSSPVVNDNDETEEQPETPKKTRRSRRGGYRRKRQQQKKVALLMAASAAERARKLQEAALAASETSSTATTEGESSSGESAEFKGSDRVVARKKGSADYMKQQQARLMMHQQYYQRQPAYFQAPLSPTPGIYQYPAYGYGSPRKARTVPNQLSAKQKGRYIAMDCEMVGCGSACQSTLARVTLIDWYGNVVMDELVKPPLEVTDYRTFVSGITKEMLDSATMNFSTARKQVIQHLKGKILVGHGLTNDLGVLGIRHPWHLTRDTAEYEPYMKMPFQDGGLWPRGLKDLCLDKLGREVQVFGRPHCPKEDALAALDLYRLVWHEWEKSVADYQNSQQAIWTMPQPPVLST